MYKRDSLSGINKEKSIINGIRFAVFCIFYYGALLITYSGEANASPVISIDNEVYDFGTILEGIILTHDFIIENKGNEPLLIPRARSTCKLNLLKVQYLPLLDMLPSLLFEKQKN